MLNIVVAAGSGSRFGSSLPKQFCMLADKPVVVHAVETLHKVSSEFPVIVVISASMVDFWYEICGKYSLESIVTTVEGGPTRWHSVRNAVMMASEVYEHDTVVAIHDGARPLVDAVTIQRASAMLASSYSMGVVPTIPVTDSIRSLTPSGISCAVERKRLHAVQTPQLFTLRTLIDAYSHPYCDKFTDDASVVEAIGGKIALSEGNPENIKITHPLDIALAEVILSHRNKS